MRRDPTEFRERFKKWKETGEYELPKFERGKSSYKYVQAGKNEELSRITNDDMSLSFQDLIVRPKDRGGNTTLGNWKRSWSVRPEPGLLIVSPEFDLISGVRGIIGMLPKKTTTITAKNAATITAKNAAKITPKLWTAAQDAAIAKGNMAEAQRLRDLHFKVSAPNTTTVNALGNPIHNYHGTTTSFTTFDPQKIGSTTGDTSGFFFTDNKSAANFYSHETGSAWNNLKLMLGLYKGHKPQVYDVYLNTTNPMVTDFHGGVDRVGREILAKEAIKTGNDANILQNIIDGPPALSHNVTIIRNPKHIKSADAVTYNDKGVRIPLGERDNFNINDIRYGLLPFLGIGAGYGLYN